MRSIRPIDIQHGWHPVCDPSSDNESSRCGRRIAGLSLRMEHAESGRFNRMHAGINHWRWIERFHQRQNGWPIGHTLWCSPGDPVSGMARTSSVSSAVWVAG